jgi:integrase
MPRPKTGHTTWVLATSKRPGHYASRLALADGGKPWVHHDPGPRSKEAHERAREKGRSWQEKADAKGLTSADFGLVPRGPRKSVEPAEKPAEPTTTPGAPETVEKYAGRWIKARTGRVASVGDNASHMEHHVLPVLGPLVMAKVTRADVERVVSALDAKVLAGDFSAKTAKNVWGTCSKLFDDATNAKPATGLRCLATDPTNGVRGPDDDEADKLLQFLYPSEFAAFIACEDVPLRWRRNATLAVYLCLRDGEQRALKWPAVDLEHGVVTIQETYDRREGEDREGTKSGAARVVPIRAELIPLLEAMQVESGGEGYVCALPSLRDMARGLRRWLKRANVERAQLHTGTSVSKQLRWHDLRATGATWLAVEGKGPTEIRDVLGHTQTSMTDRYMRAAAMLRGGRFGQPFPPLPAPLLTAPVDEAKKLQFLGGQFVPGNRGELLINQRGGRDSNGLAAARNKHDRRSGVPAGEHAW